MKKMLNMVSVCLLCLLCLLLSVSLALAGDILLDGSTYSLTTNAASRTITVTNWPGGGPVMLAWYPYGFYLNNRGSTTGIVATLRHIRTGQSNIMHTNGTFSITNTIYTWNQDTASNGLVTFSTEYWVLPPLDQLQLSTVCTNGELILFRKR